VVVTSIVQFLWTKYEPDERRQNKVDWDSMAVAFLKFCKADTHHDSSLTSVAGALSSLSQAVLERASSSKKNGSRVSSQRLLDTHGRPSQASLGAESEDTQPMDDSSPTVSSSPPTPPLEAVDAFNINNPEYRTLLSQLRALICPCLGHMFPKSGLKTTKFLVAGIFEHPLWYLRAISDSESEARSKKVPAFPTELTTELITAIKSQMVKRTNSTLVSPIPSPSRNRLGDFNDDNRTKTLSSIKHGTISPIDTEELIASPSKRFKAANGSAVPSLLSGENTHMRILHLETEQDNLRREIAVLRAEIETLKKPRNLLSS
jgi:hypothetical protein